MNTAFGTRAFANVSIAGEKSTPITSQPQQAQAAIHL
jgi:hypothetical protein